MEECVNNASDDNYVMEDYGGVKDFLESRGIIFKKKRISWETEKVLFNKGVEVKLYQFIL